MPDKKNQPEFVVTDRRRFTDEGEARPETPEPESAAPAEAAGPEKPAPGTEPAPGAEPAPFPPSSPEERAAGSKAYQESTAALDEQLRRELGAQAAPEEVKTGFDRIVEPLYVTALVQLGYMGQEGQAQRRVDIIGARQSIDTMTLLQEKTKGNLTASEATLLEEILYDTRMKYLEVTNALARAAQNPKEPA
jgi:hypothetical protein